jgi:hypothetical protein
MNKTEEKVYIYNEEEIVQLLSDFFYEGMTFEDFKTKAQRGSALHSAYGSIPTGIPSNASPSMWLRSKLINKGFNL